MRGRSLMLATLLGVCAGVSTSGNAGAAPTRNRGLTIAATPGSILAGEAVLVYGQLKGPDSAGQMVVLYHRISPAANYTVVSETRTESTGFYEFLRGDGIVLTNRSWFVRGPDLTHSRTVQESVAPLISLTSDTTTATTGQPVHFAGRVTPAHAGRAVQLQVPSGTSGDGWRTVATASTAATSTFTISHAWAVPGVYTLRAHVSSDPRNSAGDSDTTTLVITQQQTPAFTIGSSSPIITEGQPVTISGRLYAPGSTTTVEPSTNVKLYGKSVGGTFAPIATTSTGTDGGYSFVEIPIHSEVYKVETVKPARATASLFEGVQDLVTMSTSAPTATVGGSVSLRGTVEPDHTGHLIDLQRLGTDGYWHTVATNTIGTGSTYSFSSTFGKAGNVQLRARIDGGPENVGGASPPAVIDVSGVAPLSSLPPAS